MWIEPKNSALEVWEVVIHLTRYLAPTMEVYPLTRPSKRYGNRIEVSLLASDDAGGTFGIHIYPNTTDIYQTVINTLQDAITDNIKLKLSINMSRCEPYDFLRVDYEYTIHTPTHARLQRSWKID